MPEGLARHKLVFYRLLVLFLACVIFVLFMALQTQKSFSDRHSSTNTSKLSSHHNYKLSAAVELSCPDYDAIYVPNYYNQLYINWTVASRINTIVTSVNLTNIQPLINYQYNATTQKSYALYTNSVQSHGCPPSIAAPASLTPASPPDYSFSPTTTQTQTTTCNIPLALQNLNLFNLQYQSDQQNEQGSIDNLFSRQPSASQGLTTSMQQESVSIQTQFYNTIQILAQYYASQVSSIGC